MTIRMFMLVIAAMFAAGKALAQEGAELPPFNASNYPPEVRRALQHANEECTAQDGGRGDVCA
jgi:hypothetical protein